MATATIRPTAPMVRTAILASASVDLVTVDDAPARRNAVRSPRRNEVLLALRRGQDVGGASEIERSAVQAPAKPIALAEEEGIPVKANVQMSHASRGISAACRLPEFIGDHPAILKVSHRIRLVAPHRTPVLVEGPTGTGKELVARALHRLSPRSSRKSTTGVARRSGCLNGQSCYFCTVTASKMLRR